jgi:hypothetical protein
MAKRQVKPIATPPANRPFSPVIIGAVAILAIIVVAVMGVALWQNVSKPGAGEAPGGTSWGPPDAKVSVVYFMDFQ